MPESTGKNYRKIFFTGLILAVVAVFVYAAHKNSSARSHQFRLGHTGSPLLSALYIAEKSPGWDKNYIPEKFSGSADVGYALIAGEIDAGFVEPSRALIIKRMPEFRDIEVIGKITYPYGAVLAVKKGLNLQMKDLEGHTVAASEPSCNLLHAFRKDLKWLKVDPEKVKFEYMPFETMLPALEAGKVDAAVIKGSYAVLAEKLGHTIPYLQWDVAAGDECCPAIVAQTEFLLLSKKEKKALTDEFANRLVDAEKVSEAETKAVTSEATGIPVSILEALPPGEFSFADAALLKLFEDQALQEAAEKKR